MDFLDEDAKPRFLFQSKSKSHHQSSSSQIPISNSQSYNKTLIFISISISALIVTLTILFFNYEPVNSLLFWIAASLIVGPFAPISFTAGDIRVGQGSVVEFPDLHEQDKNQFKQVKKNGRNVINNSAKSQSRSGSYDDLSMYPAEKAKDSTVIKTAAVEVESERDWTEEDFEVLKKQMSKYPVGIPRRWEVITQAFNGDHKMENVVKMAKSMSDKKITDRDSFALFLKNRKPLDKRGESSATDETLVVNGGSVVGNGNGGLLVWISEEDIALLNALKVFPKEVSMRWEKIAAAVPGKTKNACMKRVTELKKGFRDSKAGVDS